ncbi:hypothetical protein S2091_0838 [Solimicrobium silvestre]|uniref:Uncharacterized protein n=1 Tax=Solimicrobium silvestre TaxID=2099400 RepID=A0A2S9H2N2_9BURK|nr:hypothetical protein S2091_0838 [Solimicrobium silvestre]
MPPWAAIAPYGTLFGLVFITSILLLRGVQLSTVAITDGGVSFAPLTSLGIALAATLLILIPRKFSTKNKQTD